MRTLRLAIRLIVTAVLLAGWGLAAAALHVLVMPGWHIGVVPKSRLTLTDTYVDTRNWTAADVAQHPELVKRLLEAGKADWLSSVAGTPGETLDAELMKRLGGAFDNSKSRK